MKLEPSLDILLASYQGERYIEAQIKSILTQNYPHFQIMVQDDGSRDATKNIMQGLQAKHPEKIRFAENKQRLGATQNFAQLLKASRCSYAMLSDQDDIWRADKIAQSMQLMQSMEAKHGGATPILVHTDLQVVNRDLRAIAPSLWKYARLTPTPSFNRLLVQNSVTGCTCLLNRALLNLLQDFPQEAIVHDGWIALVAAAFGQIAALPTPTLLYRQHAHNALGAQKMSLQAYLQRAWNSFHATPSRDLRQGQAAAFYRLYGEQLDKPKKKALEGFLAAPHMGIWKRKYLFLRHRFFWAGGLRNCTKFFLPNPF
jgi:glycosyltransferase involved in cell wall biosynthesis